MGERQSAVGCVTDRGPARGVLGKGSRHGVSLGCGATLSHRGRLGLHKAEPDG